MKNFTLPPLKNKLFHFNLVLLGILCFFSANPLYSQYAKDGDLTISASNTIVNTYTPVTTNVSIGATSIQVRDVAGDLGGLAAGDLILIYQAQGTVINTSNSISYGAITSLNGAGTYEYAYVEGVTGNQISVCPLTFGYLTAAFTQVVKVPQYDTLTINSGASITATAWQDSGAFRLGGIVAINAVNVVNNGTIDVSDIGFRGGVRENQTSPAGSTVYTAYVSGSALISAEKGESIVGFGPEYDALGGRYGRGAPANGGGGGNAHNAGGGGGANGNNGNAWFRGAGVMCSTCTGASAWSLDPDYIANTPANTRTNSSGGGRGGYTYGSSNQNALTLAPGSAAWGGDQRDPVGGLGGRPLNANPLQSIFFGGGGGAGDGNNSANNDGGDGGGIILIDAASVTGTGSFLADGEVAPPTVPGHNDSPGGGGAGGTIVIESSSIANALTLSAIGGTGGDQLITSNESEGPGGGGSGGFIAISNGTPTTTVNGGLNGTSTSASVTEFPTNGATIGATGQSISFVGDIVISCIVATNNDFSGTPINGVTGGTTASVFPNDTLNGTTFANSAVIPSITNNDGLTGLTINAAGVFTVPAGTTPGTYNVIYRICETLEPTNCDTAIAIITVFAPPCSITAISTSNLSACNDNGTGTNSADDFFTADVTVTFANAPATGTLELTGDGTGSEAVGSLDTATSHIFTGVQLPADGGAINLTATFSADLTCTFNNTNAGTAQASCSIPTADVGITKTLVDSSPYQSGETVTYTMVVSNNGPDTATNVVVTDTPTNLTIVTVSGGGCTGFPCNIASIASGSPANDITITVTATINNAGAFTNTTTVSADEIDPVAANDQDNGSDGNNNGVAVGLADVGITKTLVDSSPYQSGETVTYTMVVSNNGPDTATNVVVTDTPTNLTIVTVSGGGCTGFPCNIASIASGSPANDVTITVTATINNAGAFTNTTTVSADEIDPVAANDQDNGSDGNNNGVAAPVADVGITKTLVDSSPYQSGETVTYTMVVSNNGPDTANNVVVTDTPTNLTIVTVSGGGCTGFPCNIASIASGSPANDVTITVTATINNAGAFTNTTTVSADEIDPVAANDQDNGSDGNNNGVAAPVADVGITKTLIDSSPYQTGDTVTYTMVVSNNGPDTANNVVVTDTPTNLTIVTVSGGGCTGFPCNIASIASGSPANDITITVTATINNAGAFTNTTTVSADEIDPVAANDQDNGSDGNNNGVAAPVADVGITKTLVDSSPYQSGETVTYTMVVSNNGPDTATNVVVTDTPTNLTIVTVSGGGCTGFPCNIASIASGSPANDITITVTATINNAGAFTNTTTVSADEIDPVAANDQDNGSDGNNNGVAAPVADVGITKTLIDSSPYQTGDTVTYTMVVSNNGPDTANNVVVTDTPTNLTIVTVSGGGCTGFPCNIASIASGSPANDVTITVTATINNAGAFTNTTTVSADEIDPVAANDQDNGSDGNNNGVAAPVADVGITKTLIDSSPYQTGDTVTYTMVVSNNGPDTANNVVVTDTPTNLTIVTVSGGGCTGFPCNIASIASGSPANDITITVTATINNAGAFTNTTTVSADEIDPVAANDQDNGSDGNNNGVAAPVADVGITKTLVDSSPYQSGETVTYTMVVSNNGPDTATNVVVTDTPTNLTIVTVSGGGCTGFPCNIASIASGSPANDITITVTATINNAGAFTNTTTVSADEIDPVAANDQDNGSDGNNNGVAAPVADVGITKTLVDSSPYQSGETVTYTMVVSNNGPDTANNVVVTDTPTNLTIVTVSGGGCTGFPCNIASIASGSPANDVTITVTATINNAGAFTNTTTVSADEIDPVAANDQDNGSDGNNNGVAAPVADVGITKTLIDSSPYQTGDTVTYTMVVSNNGPDTATNVMVTDTPSNLTITSVSGGGCAGFPCNIASIASGSPANDVTITVIATIVASGTFTNSTAVSADEIDPVAANDQDNGTDGNNSGFAGPVADVGITKTLIDSSPYQTGDTVTYTMVVSNNGPDTANNVVVTDTPTNLTIAAVSGGGCTGFPCNIASIASGSPANDVTITVTATIDSAGSFTNSTSVSADETDPNIANDLDDGTDGNNNGVAAPVADLVTVKTLSSGTATPPEGDVVTFTITVTNNGPDPATGITLDDTIPAGLTATGNNGNTGGAQASSYVAPTWSIALLNSGESVTLTIEGTIDVGQDGNTITNNTTTATGAEIDPSTVGDDLTESIVVTGCIDTDGDGTCDSVDPDINDPCVDDGVVGDEDPGNPIWANADCDGDGVLNGVDPTPFDPCDPVQAPGYTGYDATNPIWQAADCDGDGVINGDEANTDGTDPYDPCDYIDGNQTVAVSSSWNDLDCDGDGVTNGDEIASGTNPQDPCDYNIVFVSLPTSTAWKLADCDGDGVSNGQEDLDGTNPLDPCDPVQNVGYTGYDNTNPIWQAADCDGDGTTNGDEFTNGTDPYDPCEDDGTFGDEDPGNPVWANSDCDGDGEDNGTEVTNGTDPFDPCDVTVATIPSPSSENYGVWAAADCDGDGETNGEEASNGTDPYDPCDVTVATVPANPNAAGTPAQTAYDIWAAADCDGDGVTNGVEVDEDGNGINNDGTNDTNPFDPCDYNAADQVIANVTAEWNALDCDGDGVTNGDEIIDGTNPQDPCDYMASSVTLPMSSSWDVEDCDGDGVPNGVEVSDGTDPQDPCDYLATSQTGPTSPAWDALDCDGDGDPNGTDPDPQDPCIATTQTIPLSTDPNYNIWAAADCDGDGEDNGTEVTNGTDPFDPCDVTVATIPSPSSENYGVWAAADCDGDGETNGEEASNGTDPYDPCDVTVATVPANPNAAGTPAQTAYDIWAAADCDGDGVTNGVEVDEDGNGINNDGTNDTNPFDPCDYNAADQVIANVTAEWNALDCDGDGVTNGDEIIDGTNPQDPCDYMASSVTLPMSSSWDVEDCDGDGVPNGVEVSDGTDPQDPCDYLATSQTGPTSPAWDALDCDGDGDPNGTDPDPQDPCIATTQTIPLSTDPNYNIWAAADCDGDGEDNGTEVTNGTDPFDPCDVTVATIPSPSSENYGVWAAADCDGDGETNGEEASNGTDPYDPCDVTVATVPANPNAAGTPAQTAYDIWAAADCDGDGVTNGVEVDEDGNGINNDGTNDTNPFDPCDYNAADQVIANVTAEWNALDCDGDGVTNGDEIIDGTDPQDPCDYMASSVTLPTTQEWEDLDCDGDGVTNGQEIIDGTDPLDECDLVVANQTLPPTAAWEALDCDGDGVTNGQEVIDGTDPTDPCDFVLASQDTTPTAAWEALDCDGDGVTNGQEVIDGTDPLDECDLVFTSQTVPPSQQWIDGDCDGDGVTNGDEVIDGTDPTDPCDFMLSSQSVPTTQAWEALDCDGDGVTNGQEIIDGTDPLDECDLVVANQDTTPTSTWNDLDCDGDGVTNGQEVIDGTDPVDPCDFVLANQDTTPTAAWEALDCDGDGVTNGQELIDGTDPLDECDLVFTSQTVPPSQQWIDGDCDGDGVTNGDEVIDGTDPTDPCDFMLSSQSVPTTPAWEALDCDGDGVTNGQEIIDGTDPLDECDLVVANQDTTPTSTWNDLDCDGDGVTNGQEVIDGTDPVDPCDFVLASQDTTPTAAWEALDCDGDGVTNGQELIDGTDPLDECDLVFTSQTVPPSQQWIDGDCDGDGVTNGDEVIDGTDPTDPCDFMLSSQSVPTTPAWEALDCDGDGVTNGQEIIDGTDPLDECDLVVANQTLPPTTTWEALDCDGDGVTNGQEVIDGTDPVDPCDFVLANQDTTPTAVWEALDCDGDGVTNGQELIDGTDPLDECDLVFTSQTLPPSQQWIDGDCDGDGVTNGDEVIDGTDPTDPCDFMLSSQSVPTTPAWEALDCDGDGVTNGQEIIDGTDPLDECDLVVANQTLPPTTTWEALDCDGDGVTNGQEVIDGTDPVDPCDFVLANQDTTPTAVWEALDCDGDGVTNGQELIDGTDPLDECDLVFTSQTVPPSQQWIDGDCDGDGVTNGDEVIDGTDPTDPCDFMLSSQSVPTTQAWEDLDCDGDGVTNGQEIIDGTDPLDECDLVVGNQTLPPTTDWEDLDCDGDGVTNGQEVIDGTDPVNPCDFVQASQDYTITTQEWKDLDCDGDGVTNGDEIDPDGNGIDDGNGTDPLDECDLVVADQTVPPSQQWIDGDCDGDGVTNGQEVIDGTDPVDPCSYDPLSQDITIISAAWEALDCDGDGVTNGQEIIDGTNPLDECDLVVANQTLPPSQQWLDGDCDGDGVTNGQEVIDGTDPTDPCDFVLASQTLPPSQEWLDADCDGDGVTNGQELLDGTDPLDECDLDYTNQTVPPSQQWLDGDCDGDGVTNGQEVIDGTDPVDPCDYDILSQDITTISSEWEALDCDGDGVTNGQEIIDGTNPLDPCDLVVANQTLPPTQDWLDGDCDGDGVTNGQEVIDGTDPIDPCDFVLANQTVTPSQEWLELDCDGDGVSNGQEIIDGTDPLDECDLNFENQDTPPSQEWLDGDCDGDGVTNGQEVLDGTDPTDPCEYKPLSQDLTITSEEWDNLDCDGDGVTNKDEILDGTNPLNFCDFILDSQTVEPSQEWLDADCDDDGLSNGDEVAIGTDPLDEDTDGDGVIDGDETNDGTDPLDNCDFVTDSQTVPPSEEWNELDCDGDGVLNGQEILDGTDPTDPCDFVWENQDITIVSDDWLLLDCDDDGISNGDEIVTNENGDPIEIQDANDNGIPDHVEPNNGNPNSDDNLDVFDIITPNGDGLNDVFTIRNIENYPDNVLEIFNRWGVKVYDAVGYGQGDNFFRGMSNGRITIDRGERLPVGTYYYVLRYVNKQGKSKRLAGPLYINRR